MEKNLIFFNLDILDKARDKFVSPLTTKLDEGSIFKSVIIFGLKLAAFVALLGGIAITIKRMLGDRGFINRHISNEYLDQAHKTGAIAGLVCGVVLSLIVAWALYAIIMKRTTELKAESYDGLMHFFYARAVPKFIVIAGEVVCVLMIYAALLSLVATLAGSAAYAPLGQASRGIVRMFPGMDFIPIQRMHFVGNYDFFAMGVKMSLMGLFLSFIALLGFYIYKEVYSFIIKLIIILVRYLPTFSIPLTIKNKGAASDTSTPTDS
jgi:hypothetical protein